MLRPALAGAMGTIKRELQSGVSQLYQTSKGNLLVVLRPEGNELVVVAVAGSQLAASAHEIIRFALHHQFNSIRFHTKVPERLTKGLANVPHELVEVRQSLLGKDELVYRIRIHNGLI